MTKKIRLLKKDINLIITTLIKENITEISLYEISKNINTYLPAITQNSSMVYRTLKWHESKFEENSIKLYDYHQRKNENIKNNINLAIDYIKYELKISKITRQAFLNILINNFKFEYHISSNFFKIHDVLNKLAVSKIEVISQNKRNQAENIYNILNALVGMKEVSEYKKKSKQFSITELYNLIDGKLSRSTIVKYIKYIYDLGIPISTTKLLLNSIKYNNVELIIKQICLYLKRERIHQITARDFSKLSKKLYLPPITVKGTFLYEDYISKKYKIKIIIKSRETVIKYKNHLLDNIDQLNNKVIINIIEGDKQPFYITENDYWVNRNINNVLEENWNSFLKKYLNDLFKKRKNVREMLFKNEKYYFNTVNKKVMFLCHKELHIKDLNIEDIIKLSYKRVHSRDHQHGVNRQSMLIAFLFYLFSKNLILFSFSILYSKHNFQHNINEVEMYLTESKIYDKYIVAEKENRILLNYRKFRKLFLLTCYSFSNNFDLINCDNNFIKIYAFLEDRYFYTISNVLYSLGAKSSSQNAISNKYVEKYHLYMKKDKYKLLTKIFNDYMDRKVALEDTKVPKSYYKKTSSCFKLFIDFLEKYHPNISIKEKEIFLVFDYPNSDKFTYQEYIDEQEFSGSTKINRLTSLCEAFSTTKGYREVFSKDKIPNYNRSREFERNSIDEDEIIYKINDIVTNRPPTSNYYKNYKVDMDTSWWPHMDTIRPFEPLLIKLHLSIPARGKTLRLTDRDTLLVYDHNNKIKGFRFESDKNKNRKDPFIVPNIWKNELNFLIKLIQYNKLYFPNLERYYPSDKTLKKGIIPLFPNFDGKKIYQRGQHMLYWTKVLIQAEIEFRNEGKNYTFVTSDKITIPKTIKELNNLTQNDAKTIKKKYDIHSLRHTGITRYIKAGMPLELVRLLSGHSGFNTILTIYYHISHEELANNWVSKQGVDFTDELKMHQNTELFIKKEIINEIKSNNSEEVHEILKKYFFFNQENRNISGHENITLKKISESEVSFWKPMSHGICTKQQCPNEIINRCSLCPYYITNYFYIQEIGLLMQLSMARVKKYSDLIIKNRKKKEHAQNSSLRQSMNQEIENFVAWLEVINAANTSYNEKDFIDDKNKSLIKTDVYEVEDTIFSIIPSLSIEHGYLEILSQTFKRELFDNETVEDLINIVANKIIIYSIKNNKFEEIEDYSNDEIIRWFLPKYDKIPKNWNTDSNSKLELEELLKIFDKKQKKIELENNNENTFLTK